MACKLTTDATGAGNACQMIWVPLLGKRNCDASAQKKKKEEEEEEEEESKQKERQKDKTEDNFQPNLWYRTEESPTSNKKNMQRKRLKTTRKCQIACNEVHQSCTKPSLYDDCPHYTHGSWTLSLNGPFHSLKSCINDGCRSKVLAKQTKT